MIIGKLDTRLELVKQTYTQNAYGERTVDTQTSAFIYADFDYKADRDWETNYH